MEPVTTLSITTLAQAFEAKELVVGTAEMLGLIASIDAKIDKLLKGDFDAGVRCLKELKHVSNENQEFLLKGGWEHFSLAVTHETLERKALAYLNLAFCQYRLGEQQVAYNTLTDFIKCEFVDEQEHKKRTAIAAGTGGTIGALGGAAAGGIAASAATTSVMTILGPGLIVGTAAVSMPVAVTVGVVGGVVGGLGVLRRLKRVKPKIFPSEEKVLLLKQKAKDFLANGIIIYNYLNSCLNPKPRRFCAIAKF